MTEQLLDRLRCRAPHREMRREGVPKHVRPDGPEPGALASEPERRLDRGLREGAAIRMAKHELGP